MDNSKRYKIVNKPFSLICAVIKKLEREIKKSIVCFPMPAGETVQKSIILSFDVGLPFLFFDGMWVDLQELKFCYKIRSNTKKIEYATYEDLKRIALVAYRRAIQEQKVAND